jgi:hypothetical protein
VLKYLTLCKEIKKDVMFKLLTLTFMLFDLNKFIDSPKYNIIYVEPIMTLIIILLSEIDKPFTEFGIIL